MHPYLGQSDVGSCRRHPSRNGFTRIIERRTCALRDDGMEVRTSDLARPDAELRRLSELGVVLLLAKGFYELVPEDRRAEETAWRPTIEDAALGMAASMCGADNVALLGPSAARAHGCYPRALGRAYVSVPTQRRRRESVLGEIRFVTRAIEKMDTVRVETDLGSGWATSVEQTALDLCRDRSAWDISAASRSEMIPG